MRATDEDVAGAGPAQRVAEPGEVGVGISRGPSRWFPEAELERGFGLAKRSNLRDAPEQRGRLRCFSRPFGVNREGVQRVAVERLELCGASPATEPFPDRTGKHAMCRLARGCLGPWCVEANH